MASIRRKPGTRYLYACFTNGAGLQEQRSTKTTNRTLALQMAEEFEQAHRNRATEFQMRRVLSDIHSKLHGRPLESTTLKSYAKTWIEGKRGEVATTTLSSYEKTLRDFTEFAGASVADQPLLHLEKKIITDYRDHCLTKTTARTANNKLKIMRVFLKAAWEDGFIKDNPAAKVKTLKTEPVIRRGFNRDELGKVMAAATGEWRGMIIFGYYIGPRLKDIALMTGRQIDLEQGVIKFATSKTDRFMNVPIAAPLAAWLRKHMPANSDAPIFPKAYKIVKESGDTTRLSQQFHEIMVKADLAKGRSKSHVKEGDGRDGIRKKNPLTFHSLRHTLTSALKNAGASEAVVRDIVGHDSASVSQEYTHIEHSTKKAALDLLPDITA